MSLSIQYLRDRAREKSDTVTARNATIQNNLEVIAACNKNAPMVIEKFRAKFARYQKDTKNPTPWKKIQIGLAKKFNSKTSTETSYEEARENLRSLASTRHMATKGLKQLTGHHVPITRNQLIVETNSHEAYMRRTTENIHFSTLAVTEKREKFEDFIREENLTETVAKIETLDAYIATNPTYEEMKVVMEKMTDKEARRVLRDHLISINKNQPEKILDLYADSTIWNTADEKMYFESFERAYSWHTRKKLYSRQGPNTPQQVQLCFRELMRHAGHPEVYTKIIDNYLPIFSDLQNESKVYLKLPLHLQELVRVRVDKNYRAHVKTGAKTSRCISRGREIEDDIWSTYDETQEVGVGFPALANSFGQLIVRDMSPRDTAVFILGANSSYERDKPYRPYILESFDKEDYKQAAINYLDSPENYEWGFVNKAVEQLSESEKRIYAKKMIGRENDVRFFHFFVKFIESEDLDAAITLLKKTGQTGSLQSLEKGVIQEQYSFTECQKTWLKESVEAIFREEQTCRYWIQDMGREATQANEMEALQGMTESLTDHIFVTYFMKIHRHERHGHNDHIREHVSAVRSKPFYQYVAGLICDKIQERIALLGERAKIAHTLTQ